MKISILSTDSYMVAGLQNITCATPLDGMTCKGHILIVDLVHPVELSESQCRGSCYIIFITDNEMIFRINDDISFSSDTCRITRKCMVKEFNVVLGRIVEKIRLKKCFWTGVAYPQPELSVSSPFLTLREKEILPWMALGYTDKQIAPMMGCAHKTANNFRSNLLSKLNVTKCSFVNFLRQYNALESFYHWQCHRKSLYRNTASENCRTNDYDQRRYSLHRSQ